MLFMQMVLSAMLFVAGSAYASADINIRTDKDDCVKSWISMDVDVTVDSESFSFDPSCRFSFDDSFKTKKGLKCDVRAGMCSVFSPKNQFEVSCDDGSSEKVIIDCPKED
jgi:hypothetical protein